MVTKNLERMKEKYQKEALLCNLIYIGEALGKSSYRRYKHVSCNHEEDLLPANVRNREVSCKVCVFEKHKKEATLEGLQIISEPFNKGYRYRLDCKHEQFIHVSAVRSGEWSCRICNISHFDKPSCVYLLKMITPELTWLKLGYTNNLKTRIKNYKLLPEVIVDIVKVISLKSGRIAIQLEKELHTKYFLSKLSDELMRKYHRQDGYTECYPESMLESLYLELSQLERKENETSN